MMRCSLLTFVILSSLTTLHAGEPIRFARTPDLSPDGKHVAFSYLGDIWVVGVEGGRARHLTMHQKHEIDPVFSPDGKFIAFSSNRHGTYDVFVVPFEGGRPTRLTFDSADDFVTDWTPDGRHLLFMSNRGTAYPPRRELFLVPVAGGRVRQVSAWEGREGAFSPDGKHLAYVRGPGTWYRKGYRGSSNDELWLCNADGSDNRRLTTFEGQDNQPMWSPDGRFLYYVTETNGTPADIVRRELLPDRRSFTSAPPQRITRHKDEAVRRARLCRDGKRLVYECGPDLFLVDAAGGEPRKLHIEVYADDKSNLERVATFTSGATEFAFSPDEKHVAFVVLGELFLMPRTGGKAKRLTENPAFDHGIAWSPDAKSILFLSDRSGHEDIYLLEPNDPDHPHLLQAHRFKTTQLTRTPEAETGVTFTPDGKRVSFLRGGKLYAMRPDGSDVRVLIDDGEVIDYEWSPDGRWLVYSRMDRHFASELIVVPAGGPTAKDPARNITRFATYNAGVTWARSGDRLAFISQRSGNQNSAYVLSLQKPAAPGAPARSDGSIDFDGIHLRVKQPASMTVSACAIANDGKRLALRGNRDGDDLWLAASDGGQLLRLTTGNLKPTQIRWSRFFSSMIHFRDGSGNLRTVNLASTAASKGPTLSTIPFQARMEVRQDELFAEMFEQSWRALNETFYDPNFHGADWEKVRARYRPLVKHCVLKEDLYALVSLMLGELNASHLGISGSAAAPEQETADLGLLFDEKWAGPGLRIDAILHGGPADRRGLELRPGDVVLAVDGRALDERTNLSALLNDQTNAVVILQVAGADPKKVRRVEIQPSSRKQVSALMYDRWVQTNADRVLALSKQRLGYIHVPDMKESGLERFQRSLYSDCFDKDGIVLDLRFNGGGYTHEKLLNYLGGKEHTVFHHRDGTSGLVLNRQDRRWTKPIVLLVNNRSYSDAEIFPNAFRALGLGKIVGQTTGAKVIGTRTVQLIDGSTFRTPRLGVFTHKGVNMEKQGVVPDVLVEDHPDQLARGQDIQLDRAVEVLLHDVETRRRNRPPVAETPRKSPKAATGAGSGR